MCGVRTLLDRTNHDLRLYLHRADNAAHFSQSAESLLELLQRHLARVVSSEAQTTHVSPLPGGGTGSVNCTLVGAVALHVRPTTAPASERLPLAGPRLSSGCWRCRHCRLPAGLRSLLLLLPLRLLRPLLLLLLLLLLLRPSLLLLLLEPWLLSLALVALTSLVVGALALAPDSL